MSTIFCIGGNYVKHAQELGNEVPSTPVVFLKAESSLYTASLAFSGETFHHEVEIILKIARDFKLNEKTSPIDIEAMALGLDLTRREVQNELKTKGLPWTTAKSFAGPTVVGK
jgi:fumarylpyruvate hydrolase